MTTLRIYGSSDDLIEIEGDFREEFNPRDGVPSYLAFSDGTVLRISYDGDWHITPKHTSDHTTVMVNHPDPTTDDYSDVCELDGPIGCVVFGDFYGKISQ